MLSVQHAFGGRPRFLAHRLVERRVAEGDFRIRHRPRMLFVVNDDRPGRIGRLGTILGEAAVNIANMAVFRNRPRSRALMVLTLDNPIPAEVLDRIRAEPGLMEPRAIELQLEQGGDDEPA